MKCETQGRNWLGGRDQKELRWQQSGKSEYGPGASCSKAQLPALLDEAVRFSHVQNSLKFIQTISILIFNYV